MTFLIERLAELRRHLEHLRELRPRVGSADDLRRDLSLHNDVLYSLLAVCQHVIDIAGELASRQGLPFADYTEAVRHLAGILPLPAPTIRELERLPGFRNVLVHEYVMLDLGRVVEALDALGPIEELLAAVHRLEGASGA
jgi:uncharacterized protein YutE (UPF0331/DUF86 family)